MRVCSISGGTKNESVWQDAIGMDVKSRDVRTRVRPVILRDADRFWGSVCREVWFGAGRNGRKLSRLVKEGKVVGFGAWRMFVELGGNHGVAVRLAPLHAVVEDEVDWGKSGCKRRGNCWTSVLIDPYFCLIPADQASYRFCRALSRLSRPRSLAGMVRDYI